VKESWSTKSLNQICQRFVSTFLVSVQKALLRVRSDMLMVADDWKFTLLSPLEMSAAFNCIHHLILLQLLQLGIGDNVLDWIFYVRPLHGSAVQHQCNIRSTLINTMTTDSWICVYRRWQLRSIQTVAMRVSLTSQPGWKPVTRAKIRLFGLHLHSSWPRRNFSSSIAVVTSQARQCCKEPKSCCW